APYDGILVAAGAPQIPRPLIEQLAADGRLVLPMGEDDLQSLVRIRRAGSGLVEDYFGECRFVRVGGSYGWGGGERGGRGTGVGWRGGAVGWGMLSAAACAGPAGLRHRVAPGENLYRIGKAYGVSHQELARLNGIKDPDRIEVGQTIVIPHASRELPVGVITP